MERMVEYLLMIKNRYKEVPVQIILWLGEGRPPYAEEVEIGPLRFRCAVRDIKELSCEALLESEDPGDNILAVLCRRGEDFWGRLSERLMRLPEDRRMEYVEKLAYLVKLRRDIADEYEALRKEVRRMPIVIDLDKDPAYRAGVERGIKEGIKEGLITETRDLVIEALEERFSVVPEDVKRKINSLSDRGILKALLRQAIRAGSIEEFMEKLRLHTEEDG
jgi:hypothetical protein